MRRMRAGAVRIVFTSVIFNGGMPRSSALGGASFAGSGAEASCELARLATNRPPLTRPAPPATWAQFFNQLRRFMLGSPNVNGKENVGKQDSNAACSWMGLTLSRDCHRRFGAGVQCFWADASGARFALPQAPG